MRRLELVRWGFVPAFVKDFSSVRPIFNAWAEGLSDKPSFRNALRRRRCLVIADGYYVGRQQESGSQPFLVRRRDRRPFGMAGLTENWLGADSSEIDTACVVTAPSSGGFAALHPRRPVIIAADTFDTWLDPDETHAGAALPLLDQPPAEVFKAIPIGRSINKAAHDDPRIQTPVGPAIPLPVETRSRRTGIQGELF